MQRQPLNGQITGFDDAPFTRGQGEFDLARNLDGKVQAHRPMQRLSESGGVSMYQTLAPPP